MKFGQEHAVGLNFGDEHVVGVNIGQEQLLAAEPLEKYHVVAAKIVRRTQESC